LRRSVLPFAHRAAIHPPCGEVGDLERVAIDDGDEGVEGDERVALVQVADAVAPLVDRRDRAREVEGRGVEMLPGEATTPQSVPVHGIEVRERLLEGPHVYPRHRETDACRAAALREDRGAGTRDGAVLEGV